MIISDETGHTIVQTFKDPLHWAIRRSKSFIKPLLLNEKSYINKTNNIIHYL
jgi:hypothetical protein